MNLLDKATRRKFGLQNQIRSLLIQAERKQSSLSGILERLLSRLVCFFGALRNRVRFSFWWVFFASLPTLLAGINLVFQPVGFPPLMPHPAVLPLCATLTPLVSLPIPLPLVCLYRLLSAFYYVMLWCNHCTLH